MEVVSQVNGFRKILFQENQNFFGKHVRLDNRKTDFLMNRKEVQFSLGNDVS